jgi:hypothetical protein
MRAAPPATASIESAPPAGCLGGTASPEPAAYRLRVPAGAVAPPRGAPAFALGDLRVAG